MIDWPHLRDVLSVNCVCKSKLLIFTIYNDNLEYKFNQNQLKMFDIKCKLFFMLFRITYFYGMSWWQLVIKLHGVYYKWSKTTNN